MTGIIYCAISPSNKKYYGYTINLTGRKYKHHRDAFVKHKNQYFHNALRKYGFENFEWKVIETHAAETKLELRNILCEREIYWIEKDKTYLPEFGYNMTKGGDGVLGYKFSKEQYEKVCKFNKELTDKQRNIPRTKQTKEKMSTAKKGKTYEEIYGKEKAEQLKLIRHNHTQSEKTKEKQRTSRLKNIEKNKLVKESINI